VGVEHWFKEKREYNNLVLVLGVYQLAFLLPCKINSPGLCLKVALSSGLVSDFNCLSHLILIFCLSVVAFLLLHFLLHEYLIYCPFVFCIHVILFTKITTY